MSANQSLVGGIQPDVLSNIMSSADPTGEFARYNVATLVKKPHYWNGDSEVSLDVTSLLVGIYKAVDGLPTCKFYLTPEAYKLFEKHHNHAETKANKETIPALIYQYSKADGKILRWALLYHILEAVANGQIPNESIGKRPMQIAALRMRYQINQVRAILARMESSEPSKLSQIYQLALKKNEPIAPRDVKRAKHVDDISEAVRLFQRLEEMGQGRVIKTSQTHKFVAYSEPKTGEVAEGDRRWQQTTATFSNNLEPNTTPTSDNKGGSKVAVDSNPDTAKDTPEIWQYGSTSFFKQEVTYSQPQSINDFKVGQKIHIDGSHYIWGIVASIEKNKGLIRDTDGAAFKWQRCTIVNDG